MTWDYTYDPMGRLETVYKDNGLAEAYSYDGQGNRVEETNVLRGVSRTYTHDDEDKIVWAGLDAYMYDVDGFLTSRTVGGATDTFDYSSRGELLSATLASGDIITYDHDPMGRRIAKRVNGTITEKYLWQDATTLLAVYDGSDNLLQRFEYADGRMPVAMTAGGQVYYLVYDQVGSLRAVFDSAGSEIKRVDYDSFGNILSDSNPTFTVPFGFAGGLHDRDTGLVRFGARDYDPATGKWTAKDPIDFAGGDLTLLSYAGQDPVNYIDPFGLELIQTQIDGMGITYIDSAMVPHLDKFYSYALQKGVKLNIESIYRTPEHQDRLKKRYRPKGIAVSDNSLHMAGMAIDVTYNGLRDIPNGLSKADQQQIIRWAADKADLAWGGDWTNSKPEPWHFYLKGINYSDRSALINAATNNYLEFTGQLAPIWDPRGDPCE